MSVPGCVRGNQTGRGTANQIAASQHNCKTAGLQATKLQDCKDGKQPDGKNTGLQALHGLHIARLEKYSSQAGGPQGAGG